MKQSFNEKLERILVGVKNQIIQEGIDLKALKDDEVKNIAIGYMLVEQCLWFRVENDEKVSVLLTKFQEITEHALELLKKHNFEDLVYTFRKNYTNLYEVQGVGRKYNLSSKDYNDFIMGVENGSIVVLNKPRKTRNMKVKDDVETTSSFMQNLIAKAPKIPIVIKEEVKENVEVVVTPQSTTTTKKPSTKKTSKDVAPKDVAPKTKFLENLDTSKEHPKDVTNKKGWVEHDKQGYLEPKKFLKIKLVDKKNVFGRFENIKANDDKSISLILDVRGTLCEIDVVNIDKVFTYQR